MTSLERSQGGLGGSLNLIDVFKITLISFIQGLPYLLQLMTSFFLSFLAGHPIAPHSAAPLY